MYMGVTWNNIIEGFLCIDTVSALDIYCAHCSQCDIQSADMKNRCQSGFYETVEAENLMFHKTF